MKKTVIALFVIMMTVLVLAYLFLNIPLNKPSKNMREAVNAKEYKTETDKSVADEYIFHEWPSPDKRHKIITLEKPFLTDVYLVEEKGRAIPIYLEDSPWWAEIIWAPNGKRFIIKKGINNADVLCSVYSISDDHISFEAELGWKRNAYPEGLFHRDFKYIRWLDNNRISYDYHNWGELGGYGKVDLQDHCIYFSNSKRNNLVERDDVIITSALSFLPDGMNMRGDLPRITKKLKMFANKHGFLFANDDLIIKWSITEDEYKELLGIFSKWISRCKEIKDSLDALYRSSQVLNSPKFRAWTYKGIVKETEGTQVRTKQINEIVPEWNRVEGADMVKMPLFKGKEWGHECDFKRTDHRYCYYVKDVKYKDLSYIKGIGKGTRKIYTISYNILSSHDEIDYVEGIGIIRYEYVHHGTVDEKYIKLVEVKQ